MNDMDVTDQHCSTCCHIYLQNILSYSQICLFGGFRLYFFSVQDILASKSQIILNGYLKSVF